MSFALTALCLGLLHETSFEMVTLQTVGYTTTYNRL
jgi:hypothetical protein